jgi:hypothetical protein
MGIGGCQEISDVAEKVFGGLNPVVASSKEGALSEASTDRVVMQSE